MTPSPRQALLPIYLTTALVAQDAPAVDREMMRIGAAYAAKVAASAVFVSGRTIESVREEEFASVTALDQMMRGLLHFHVDIDKRAVTATLGPIKATAVATDGLGCTLLIGDVTTEALQERSAGSAREGKEPDAIAWPRGDHVPALPDDPGIDLDALRQALDAAFTEPAAGPPRHTRAIVVVHRGRLVAERYREGYDRKTLLPGWSMTKTLVDALVGIRVRQGRLTLDGRLQTPAWPAGDARAALTLDDLLTMDSGLAWNESYSDPTSDVLRMLFTTADHATLITQKAQDHPAGTAWAYASGSTNLACRELRASFAADAEYWAFPRKALFAPLGMDRALIETDPSGTFVGSSYGFATALDWARVGMLYLNDGVFAGERILPEGWVARASTPAPASGGRYGSQIWLNADPDGDGPEPRPNPELPDLLRLDGHEGQSVIIVPDADLVVVRLGCTKAGNSGTTELLRRTIEACAR